MDKQKLILIKSIKKLLKEMRRYQRGTINLSSAAAIESYSSTEREVLYKKVQSKDTEHADQKRHECEAIIYDVLKILMNLGHSKEEILKHFSSPDSDYISIFCSNLEDKIEPSKTK